MNQSDPGSQAAAMAWRQAQQQGLTSGEAMVAAAVAYKQVQILYFS